MLSINGDIRNFLTWFSLIVILRFLKKRGSWWAIFGIQLGPLRVEMWTLERLVFWGWPNLIFIWAGGIWHHLLGLWRKFTNFWFSVYPHSGAAIYMLVISLHVLESYQKLGMARRLLLGLVWQWRPGMVISKSWTTFNILIFRPEMSSFSKDHEHMSYVYENIYSMRLSMPPWSWVEYNFSSSEFFLSLKSYRCAVVRSMDLGTFRIMKFIYLIMLCPLC